MSIREQILAALATRLATVAGGRVYRSRGEQLPALPAVVIRPKSETSQQDSSGTISREFQISVAVFVRGDAPDSVADAIIDDIRGFITGDFTLGMPDGVEVRPGFEIAWDFEAFDHVCADITLTVEYRTFLGES